MAYKPKYAQAKSSKPAPRQQKQPRAERSKEPEKMSRKMLIFFIVLGIVIVPLSSYLTFRFLGDVWQNVGRPKSAVQAEVADMQILDFFGSVVSENVTDVRNSVRPAALPDVPEEIPPVTEEIPPVRKQYWIEEGTLVAPEPNQELFGRTDDREVMAQVLHDARWLLDGQETYFQPEQQLYEDSIVRYYLDDSIFAITWQEVHDGSIYTFSEVKVSHPSQFRRHLAGGEYGSDMQYLTTEMAAEVNAVVASAGDFYRFRDFGAVVYQGEAKRVEGTYAETCYIDANGDMHFTYPEEVLTVQEVQAFVDEHDIQFSLAFGPVLVDGGEIKVPADYILGEVNGTYSRAAICQWDKLHYLIVNTSQEQSYWHRHKVRAFAQFIKDLGCNTAYALDGGQTTAIVMNDELVTLPDYKTQRRISDIIYFATALPNGG